MNKILEGKKILVVDDSKTQRKNLKNILEKYKVDVVEAENGIDGIKKAFEVLPDLVISDVVMPEMNGYGLSFLLTHNEYTSHIPIIILTSQDHKIDKFWGIKSGCKKFLIKGVNENVLIESIIELLKQSESHLNEGQRKKLGRIRPQSFLLEIFDEILKENVLIEELYSLHNYAGDEKSLINSCFSFFDLLFDFVAAGIYKESYQGKNLYLKFNYECSNKIKTFFKNDIEEFTEDKNIFKELVIKLYNGNFLTSSSNYIPSNKTIFKFVYENQYRYGVFIYHRHKIKYPIVKNILKSGLKVLFNVDRLIDKAVMLSIIDGLTGAFNRRYLEDTLKKDFDKFVRYNHKFSIIMMDIDHFKRINDTYGHQAGDEVLKHLVKTVKKSIRTSDIIARYGGEEFCIVCYETENDDPIYLAERIRSKIKNSEVVYKGKKIKYTVSFGVSTVNKNMKNHEDLIRKADAALYRAKNNGRDRIEFEA